MRIYVKNMKKNKILDPTDDAELQKLLDKINENYVEPYIDYKRIH